MIIPLTLFAETKTIIENSHAIVACQARVSRLAGMLVPDLRIPAEIRGRSASRRRV